MDPLTVARVVIVDAYPHVLAGAQRATLTVACGLRDRLWSVEIVVPGEGVFPDAVRAEGITCTVSPVSNALRRYGGQTSAVRNAARAALAAPGAWRQLASHLRSRADIVHVNDHRGLALAGAAGRLARVPVVWHLHSIVDNLPLTLFGSVVAKQTIVPSACVLDVMAGARALRNVNIIPYAVPERAWTAPTYHPGPQPTIVTVGRLHPDKGLDVLLHAVAAIRARHPGLRVRICGPTQEGLESYAAQLRDQVRTLSLDDVVEFVGSVAHPGETVATGTVFVQPSRPRTEIQPLAVLEALVQGVPIVATRVGDLPNMIDDGVNGLLVEPSDSGALAQALDRVLSDPDFASRLARSARTRAADRYTTDAHVSSVISVYERVLAGTNR